ncbi:glycosyltransferase [Lonsdalea quercina]|uniref:glycosyltransferase n=1 Tax=Lonsdalea quercina TaxID=71657 RepID=UPI003976E701
MGRLFISVISHNHDAMIINSNTLAKLAKISTIILKCNTPATSRLKDYACKNGITIIDEDYKIGFGKNNNKTFNYASEKLGLNDDDLFLVLNPDVIIESDTLKKLISYAQKSNNDIFTLKLFRDKDKKIIDSSVKSFPRLLSPLSALVRKNRSEKYNKKTTKEPIKIDWAAGSFLLFKAKAYKNLEGFDERFFMYFEDVDICRRAKKAGYYIIYHPRLEAIHIGAYDNRNIFSKNFYWYFKSYFQYHFPLLKCFSKTYSSLIKQ